MNIQNLDRPLEIVGGKPFSITVTKWPQCGRITIAYAGRKIVDKFLDFEPNESSIDDIANLARQRIVNEVSHG